VRRRSPVIPGQLATTPPLRRQRHSPAIPGQLATTPPPRRQRHSPAVSGQLATTPPLRRQRHSPAIPGQLVTTRPLGMRCRLLHAARTLPARRDRTSVSWAAATSGQTSKGPAARA
jgi:hypothetical protein